LIPHFDLSRHKTVPQMSNTKLLLAQIFL